MPRMTSKFTLTEEFKRTWDEEIKNEEQKVFEQKVDYVPYRKNVVREVVVVVDVSESIEKSDYLPTVRSNVAQNLKIFYEDFIKTNPLSTISFLAFNTCVQNEMTHFNEKLLSSYGFGSFALTSCLKYVNCNFNKSITSKEILIITASTSIINNEAGIEEMLKSLQQSKIRINIISLCGEITFFKNLCKITDGKFMVPRNVHEFPYILKKFVVPGESHDFKCSLVEIGFAEKLKVSGLCMCHLTFQNNLYSCPRCDTNICSIPMQCPICNLNLISPIQICSAICANYQLELFEAVEEGFCRICNSPGKYSCGKCKNVFCSDCNYNVHTIINFCPFCN